MSINTASVPFTRSLIAAARWASTTRGAATAAGAAAHRCVPLWNDPQRLPTD